MATCRKTIAYFTKLSVLQFLFFVPLFVCSSLLLLRLVLFFFYATISSFTANFAVMMTIVVTAHSCCCCRIQIFFVVFVFVFTLSTLSPLLVTVTKVYNITLTADILHSSVVTIFSFMLIRRARVMALCVSVVVGGSLTVIQEMLKHMLNYRI